MRKNFRKALSLLLCLTVIASCMVFVMPSTSAATYPNELYNGTTKVNYTQSDAQQGKYLVEVDVVKYNPNSSKTPESIKSDAGDIIITYKPDNGTSPEVSARYEDIIAANEFNYSGDGTFKFYAVLAGFPQSATVSLKKTNVSENDTGLYTGIKIWDIGIGSFTNIYDFSAIERSNGVGTNDLIFSEITTLLQNYPYAKEGSTSGSNLTLPTGTTPNSANQLFSVIDQWGVTMISPKISYTPVIGLGFSQNKNLMTVKGTGDANNPSSSSRTVTLTATYDTLNTVVANNYSIQRSFVVYNSSTMTYAPTFANREKAGIAVSFRAGNTAAEQFALNSSYQMTTTNYIVLKNNSSRTAKVTLSTASSDKLSLKTTTESISAGGSVSIQLVDKKSASANYDANITVTYTLDGLYDAATGMLASLNTSSTIPFVYNSVTAPKIYVKDEPTFQSNVNVYMEVVSSKGILNQTAKDDNKEKCSWTVDYYVNRDNLASKLYTDAGLGFRFTLNKSNTYYFQNSGDSGKYQLGGSYDTLGSFGFTSGSVQSTTNEVTEKAQISLGSSSGTVTTAPFYGTIFAGSSTTNSPAKIAFKSVEIESTTGINNSGYVTLDLNIYSYSKSSLRSQINTYKNAPMLSCYFNTTRWNNTIAAASSSLKKAQIQLGTDMTSQYNITAAGNTFSSDLSTLKSNSTNGTYALTHNKHEGDINSAISDSFVDFYVFELNSSNNLRFNSTYADECNKHTATYMATLSSKGTYDYTYDYWNIDFTQLNEVLNNYNSISLNGQFSNTQEAIGSELLAATSTDTSSATAKPTTQKEVDEIAVNLQKAMRNLEYTSYDMTVNHKMLSPDGSEEINNDIIQSFTGTYNKTTTYGEYLDGLADLNDGTYTIKNVHFVAQPDPTFAEYSASYYYKGITDEFICTGPKTIDVIYYAKPIDDTKLDEYIDETLNSVGEWQNIYTKSTLNAFAEWFDSKYEDGTLSYNFSVFDDEMYQAVLAEYQAELDKLDPIITEQEVKQLKQFVMDYEMLTDFTDSICNGSMLVDSYAQAYENATELLELEAQNDAGSKAAHQILDNLDTFVLNTHEEGAHKLLTAPKNGIDGSYYILCSSCGNIVGSGVFDSPDFNTLKVASYDYAQRGAALKITNETSQSSTQGMRFTASCLVPEDAEVVDFGFVYTQTKYLNGGVEPENNDAVNVDMLVDGGMYMYKMSMIDGNYSIRATDDGDVYTYNLVLNVNKANWNTHYAARSYIVYSIDGIEVTVYDSTYSSRSAAYLAQCVVNNKNESKYAREMIAQKFGL